MAASRGIPGPRRAWRALVRRLNYVWGPPLASGLRRRWVILNNPHAEIRFGPSCRLRRGFKLDMPDGGRFVTGAGADFRDGFRAEVSAGGSIEIGDSCVFDSYSLIRCSTSVTIGDRAVFGPSATIDDGNPRFRHVSKPLASQGFDFRPVRIGNDVTALSKCTLLADIGIKVTVAANSVVTAPVPPFSLVGGVPARLIDYFGPPELEPPEWAALRAEQGIADPPARAGRLEVSGHSIPHGGGVSSFDRRYTTRLAELLDATEANHSVAGAIACWPETGADPGDGGHERVLERVLRPADVTAEHPASFHALTHYGPNDLAVLGPSGLLPFEHALRTVISRHRAVAVFDAEHQSVVRDSSSVRISIPDAFPGGSVSLGFLARPGEDEVLPVELDGSPARVLDTRGAAEAVTGKTNTVVVRITAIEPGGHTISARGPAARDFGYWQFEPDPGPPVLVPLAHRFLDWSRYALWPNPPSDADLEALNASIRAVASEFGPRVGCLDVESVLRRDESLLSWEGVYPNDEGHELIARAACEALEALTARETQKIGDSV